MLPAQPKSSLSRDPEVAHRESRCRKRELSVRAWRGRVGLEMREEGAGAVETVGRLMGMDRRTSAFGFEVGATRDEADEAAAPKTGM